MPPQTGANSDPLAQLGVPATSTPAGNQNSNDPLNSIGVPAVPATAPPEQPGVLSRIAEGAKQFAAPVVDTLKPPETPTEQVTHAVAGDNGLEAYRGAKQIVQSVEGLIKASAAEYPQAVKDYQQAVQDFHNRNYRNAAASGVSLGSDVLGMVQPTAVPAAQNVRELAQGAKPGGNMATPLTRDVLTAGTALLGGAEADSGAVSDAISEIPGRIANPFRKVGEAYQKTFMGSDIQPTLKSGIKDVWNNVADESGVPRPTTSSVQDMGEQVGDSILARSKANFKKIDAATDNRFSGLQKSLKDVNNALRSVTNDAEEQALMVRKIRLELQTDQMFDEALVNGVTRDTVDAAKADFKKAQAIFDTNHQIRMSTTGVRPGMPGAEDVPEEVNPKSLMNRSNKLYNSGRIQEAMGEDNASDLIGHTAKAQKMARNVARNRKAAAVVGGGAVAGAELAHQFTQP